MKKQCLYLIFLLSISVGYAQSLNMLPNSRNVFIDGRANFTAPKDSIANNEIKGSRFLGDDSYHSGELWTLKGYYKNQMAYRFDQFERTVEVKLPSGKEMLLDENDILILKIFIKNQYISFKQVTLPNEKNKALIQVIYESPTLQLLRDSKKIITYNRGQNVYEFENAYQFYIVRGQNNPLDKIQISVKSLTKVFPSKRSKIESFFKSKKSKKELTLSKLADLMRKLDE